MSKKQRSNFYWDGERGICRCTITVSDGKYVGYAYVHPLDADMMSEKVGQEIAYNRAIISMLKGEKRKLKLELRGLNSLYYSMKHSPHFNQKSYEAKMLYRQIKMRNDDIETIDEMVQDIQDFLTNYINKKDELYQHIRTNRSKLEKDKGE